MTWLHYSPTSIHQFRRSRIGQVMSDSPYQKPHGFWITDDSDQCWKSWCVDEGFHLHRLTYKHEVVLDESRVRIIQSEADIVAFTHAYQQLHYRRRGDSPIDWPKVAHEYAGVIITPYQWSVRLEFDWYYGWDCAGGVIWDGTAIKSVRLIGVDFGIIGRRFT